MGGDSGSSSPRSCLLRQVSLAASGSSVSSRVRVSRVLCPRPGIHRKRRKRLSEPSVSSQLVRVVCLTGMPGCGKEEALVVAQTLGFSVVRMGDVVREEALGRGLPITDPTVAGLAHAERT